MPIVSHTLETNVQADGGTSNILRMYDQDSHEYMQSFFAPSNFNTQLKIDLMLASMNEQLAASEFEHLLRT